MLTLLILSILWKMPTNNYFKNYAQFFVIAIGDIFGLGGSSLISRLFEEKRDDWGKLMHEILLNWL